MQVDFLGVAALTANKIDDGAVTKPAAGQANVGNQALPQDTASLSSNSVSVDSLTRQALASTEARAAKVETLRQVVANAEYALDPSLIADAIISNGVQQS